MRSQMEKVVPTKSSNDYLKTLSKISGGLVGVNFEFFGERCTGLKPLAGSVLQVFSKKTSPVHHKLSHPTFKCIGWVNDVHEGNFEPSYACWQKIPLTPPTEKDQQA